MNMNVRWSEQAGLEFVSMVAYVANKFGNATAIKAKGFIDEAVNDIAQFPKIGKVSFTDEETSVEFREFATRLNSVVYTVYKNEIYIVSIWSNRRNRKRLYSSLHSIAKEL